ncbi:serine hydrolase domain-containing protein [Pseudidiomarina sp.]|uniref:serine hydrolase domain-containing protein n=1 Tax=Pseudidiomarina sp. TaxID=2081707 RepID=UPI00299F1362|nr:serine hydrolase domain-containing protein [Pseudidiomarina sp.]MDX1705364.1 serine hydrolase domain-containing protein [Pseudidiomarina sp.]
MKLQRLIIATIVPVMLYGFSLPAAALAEADQKSLDALVQSVYQPDLPGATVVVAKGGELVYSGARGMADLEMGVPLAPEHIFRLASVTKQYTAAAILTLVDEGKLKLDDPVSRWWPDSAYGDVTVHQLLNHTSGIASYTSIPGYMTDERIRRDLSTDELIATFSALPVDFAPGAEWRYNNSGYVLLGAIIEDLTGKPWHQYIAEKLLVPRGITNTDYYPDQQVVRGRVHGYHPSAEGPINAPWLSMSQPHAAGALSGTALDVSQWQYALHTGKVLPDALYERMIAPSEVSGPYGYGLQNGSVRGLPVIEHGGGIHGFATYALWMPDHEISVVVLTNYVGHSVRPGVVAHRLAAIAAGKPYPVEQPRIELSAEQLQAIAGTYRIDENTIRTLKIKEGQLISQRQGGAESIVYPVTPDRFVMADSVVYFDVVRAEQGLVTGVNFYQQGSNEAEFAEKISDEIVEPKTIELNADQRARLVGDYQLQPGFIISVRDTEEGMTAQATGQGAFTVVAESAAILFNDQYGIKMVFDLPADGAATALTLHQGGQQLPAPRVEE